MGYGPDMIHGPNLIFDYWIACEMLGLLRGPGGRRRGGMGHRSALARRSEMSSGALSDRELAGIESEANLESWN